MSLHVAPIQGFLSNFLPNERGGGARHYQLYDENICDQPFLFCYFAVSINMFDYVGAILSYLIIAIALFGGKFDNMSTTALGGEISRVCMKGLCLYLFQYPASENQ